MTMAKNKYGGLCAPRHGAAIGPRGADFVWCMEIIYNQNSHNLKSSLNRLRMATLQYKSGLRFIFSVQELHQI